MAHADCLGTNVVPSIGPCEPSFLPGLCRKELCIHLVLDRVCNVPSPCILALQ